MVLVLGQHLRRQMSQPLGKRNFADLGNTSLDRLAPLAPAVRRPRFLAAAVLTRTFIAFDRHCVPRTGITREIQVSRNIFTIRRDEKTISEEVHTPTQTARFKRQKAGKPSQKYIGPPDYRAGLSKSWWWEEGYRTNRKERCHSMILVFQKSVMPPHIPPTEQC